MLTLDRAPLQRRCGLATSRASSWCPCNASIGAGARRDDLVILRAELGYLTLWKSTWPRQKPYAQAVVALAAPLYGAGRLQVVTLTVMLLKYGTPSCRVIGSSGDLDEAEAMLGRQHAETQVGVHLVGGFSRTIEARDVAGRRGTGRVADGGGLADLDKLAVCRVGNRSTYRRAPAPGR